MGVAKQSQSSQGASPKRVLTILAAVCALVVGLYSWADSVKVSQAYEITSALANNSKEPMVHLQA